jgi:prevent-host-death family protein
MEVSTKELRIQPGRIIDQVVNGEEVTVTFRGKALARIVPIVKRQNDPDSAEDSIFGMWKDISEEITVDDLVRSMRKGRSF